MEIVDIINKDNRIVSKATKEDAHRNGLLHRCIIAELIDAQGNWTLVQQANDRQDAGQYVSPVGGHIQSGETEKTALIRETKEEVNVASFSSKRVGQAIYNRQVIGRKENHLFILYEIYSNQIPKLNHESISYKKFTLDQIHKEISQNPETFGNAFHFVFNTFYK